MSCPLQGTRMAHQRLCCWRMASTPVHEGFRSQPMLCHELIKEWPPAMGCGECAYPLGGMRDRPDHEFVRLLGVMAVPLKETSCSLRVGTCPVAQFTRCLRVNLRPSFERNGTGRCWSCCLRRNWSRWRGRWWRRCRPRMRASERHERDGKKTGFQRDEPLGHGGSPEWGHVQVPLCRSRATPRWRAISANSAGCTEVTMILGEGRCEALASVLQGPPVAILPHHRWSGRRCCWSREMRCLNPQPPGLVLPVRGLWVHGVYAVRACGEHRRSAWKDDGVHGNQLDLLGGNVGHSREKDHMIARKWTAAVPYLGELPPSVAIITGGVTLHTFTFQQYA